jgi:hypothetical protein
LQFSWNTTFPVFAEKVEGCYENCMEIATWYLQGHEDTLPLHRKSSFLSPTNLPGIKESDVEEKETDILLK